MACMAVGTFGSTLEIDNTYHYFANGSLFGVGLTIFISGLREKKQVNEDYNDKETQ